MNIDRAALGSLGFAKSGGIFWNCKGFVREVFAVFFCLAFSYEVELIAALHAIDLAMHNRCTHLWLEYDSSYVVQVLHLNLLWYLRSFGLNIKIVYIILSP